MTTTCTQPKPFERLLAARQALAKSDVIELERQIAATDQIIHRLRELLHRRILHRAMLVITKGERIGELCIDMLNYGSRPPYTPLPFLPPDPPPPPPPNAAPLATSRKISFTPDERETFYASLARHCSNPSLDTSTSQIDPHTASLPADFIDVDPDGHS